MSDQTKIEKNEDTFFRPYILKAKTAILGNEKPPFFTRLVFYFGITLSFIFALWNVTSYIILLIPNYLKEHKQVDVFAILELRARELGFDESTFIDNLGTLFSLSAISWSISIICFFAFWRKKKWSSFIIVASIVCYTLAILILCGTTFWVEDTTKFDKISLLILLVLVILNHLFVFTRKEELADEKVVEEEEE